MLTLYHGGGTIGFGWAYDDDLDPRPEVLRAAQELLTARGFAGEARLLGEVPFVYRKGTNDFGDEFPVLHAALPIPAYERIRKAAGTLDLQAVAEVLHEVNAGVRFIAIEPATSPPPVPAQPLTDQQIYKLVHKYIGVIEGGPNHGYLADFSYSKVEEFFRSLGIDVSQSMLVGRTRDRFKTITKAQPPAIQADIVEAVLERYKPGSTPERTALASEVRSWLVALKGSTATVETPILVYTSEVVGRALADADHLIRTSGATSGVDRIHTALHGFLRQLCVDCGVTLAEDAEAPAIFGELRRSHPAFKDLGPREEDMLVILRSFGKIVDKLGPLRNDFSVVHPNEVLLDEPEARLVIHSTKTILHYLNDKVRRSKPTEAPTPPSPPADDYTSFGQDIPF